MPVVPAQIMRTLTRFILLFIPLSAFSTMQAAVGPSTPTVDSLCLSEILISTPIPYDPAEISIAQRKAEGAHEAIRQGARFEDMAKKYSDGPSAAYGGELGVFKRGQLAKSIEDKVFAMKVGDVSDVIRTKQGFAILKVADCSLVSAALGSSGVQIIGDTQGIDFEPYVLRLREKVYAYWYSEVPPSAETKTGDLTIEFAITTDGKVTNMRVVSGSGDKVLDHAACEGITKSSPFPPLPSEFTGPYLALRFHFSYNPHKSKLD